MSGIEFFKSHSKWGWRLRAASIEFTRPAVFGSQETARVNALADVRLAMASLGIREDTTTPPPPPPVTPSMSVEYLGDGTARVRWVNL